MKDFEFYNPVNILFGKDQLSKLGSLIPANQKILMLYGGGSIKRNGVYDRVRAALPGRTIVDFGGIEPNPSYETCMKAVEEIKKNDIGFLLAVGGGSVIDATKFIGAAALYTKGDPWDILANMSPVTASLPLGTVLTLPATGTEMNKNSVISRKSTVEKFAFSSPYSFPKFSVLLPDAAGSLPENQVANGIADAFVHVIEQYLTYPVNAPIQDRFAEAVLLTLIEEGPKVYANPADYEAMSNLVWSASMALNGLLSCGVPGDWSVHNIGHELTALHGIDHARTLAVVLPGIWNTLKEEKMDKLVQYGERVWNINSGTRAERADAAIAKTTEFFESLGIKTRLSDYGVGQETIDKVVNRFETRKWIAMGDRRLVTPSVVRKVLESRL
jgi:NADP-dependent alcohol dehydrogenase